MPYLFSYLVIRDYIFIVQVLALHLYDDSFSLAWLLSFLMSFASLVSHIVCLFYTPQSI